MKRGLLNLVIVSLFLASLYWYIRALAPLYKVVTYNPWSANRAFMYDYSPGKELQRFLLWVLYGTCFLAAAILSKLAGKTA